MTLVMGIVAAIGLLILIAARFADPVELFKMMRRDRTPVVAPQPVRALDLQTQARLTELVEQENKIQAINLIREETGAALKEAMDVADQL